MTYNIPSLPQNIDPRIADILRRKAQAGITITKTEQPRLRTQSIDAADPVPLPSAPAETRPVGDTELAALLAGIMPRIDNLIRQAIHNVRSDGRLSMAEALALVPEIRNITSMVVGEVLPQIKGQSAYDLVTLVLAALVQEYVSPRLPAILRPYLTAQAIRAAINGLQWAYDQFIRPRLKAKQTPAATLAML